MPVSSASGASSTALGEENKLLPVEVTSAVDLDEDTVKSIGERDRGADRSHVELTSKSIRPDRRPRDAGRQHGPRRRSHRLDQLRGQSQGCRRRVSVKADLQIKPDEITSILKARIEGLDNGEADLSEVGTVLSIADGIARVHGLDNCMSLSCSSCHTASPASR